MFPISIRGEFEVGALDAHGAQAVLDGVQSALTHAGGVGFVRTSAGITFRGVRLGPSWQPLVMVGRSEVTFTTGAVASLRYRFSLMPATIFSLVAIAVMSAFTYRSAQIETLGFASFALLFLVVVSYFLRSAQLRAILRRGAGLVPSSA